LNRASTAAALATLALAGTAHAGGTPSAQVPTVDWARGLVTATGVGVADRHAPNPAVARGTSRRAAEDMARAALVTKLGDLPVAGGGTVALQAQHKLVALRLERAVASAVVLDAEPETDGAWRVTMALPIEAVRQAIDGPRKLPAAGDTGPPVVIVDGVKAQPAVGWTVGGKHVATVWVQAVPAWANAAPHVTATKAAGGAIEIAGTDATDATLFVIRSP
jgi:hypothetical protein